MISDLKHRLLETPRLKLRHIVPDDIEKIFEGLSHPEVIRYYGVSYDTLEATEIQMKWFRSLEENNVGKWWAIRLKAGGDFLGAVGFNNFRQVENKVEIGFWLLRQFWGQGLMHEAVKISIEAAFKAQIKTIEATVESGNEASMRLLKELKFHCVRRVNNAEIKNGKAIDLLFFEINQQVIQQ